MKIDSFRDLKKLVQLCQSLKVKSFTLGDMTLELYDMPDKPKRVRQVNIDPGVLASNSVDENIQIPQMDRIDSDELTEEQLLYYSAPSSEPQ